MINFAFKMACLLAISARRAGNKIDEVEVEDSPSLELDKACNEYADCFNCTLANCQWTTESAACHGHPNENALLSIKSFFQEGSKCGDPLGACTSVAYNNTQGFKFQASDQPIPAGYFCIGEPQRIGRSSYQMLVNYTKDSDGDNQEIVSLYTKVEASSLPNEKPREIENFINDFTIQEMIDYYESFPLTSIVDIKIAYVNLAARSSEEASAFEVQFEKVSSYEVFSQLAYPLKIVFVVFLILIGVVVVLLCWYQYSENEVWFHEQEDN